MTDGTKATKPADPTDVLALVAYAKALEGEIKQLRAPFRSCDDQDWQYIASVIPDGGRGRFWKAVLGEMRAALKEE